MNEKSFTLDDIVEMTLQDGENWAVAHARRLLKLIDEIGQGISYDSQALTLAVYLHDWGAFPRYAQKGVEHALRSRQVAESEILPFMDLSPSHKELALEAIELHDYRDTRPANSNEALLLREADMLEFLGVVGMAHDSTRSERPGCLLSPCFKKACRHPGAFHNSPCSSDCSIRLDRMEQCLHWLEEESFGVL